MACARCFKCLFDFKRKKYNRYLNFVRHKSQGTKVVLLNSYSKVGILTAYLLKKTHLFGEICLYEPRNIDTIEGTAADLNNINTPSHVTFVKGKSSLPIALQGSNIVVMMEKAKTIEIDQNFGECKNPLKQASEILGKAFNSNAEYCATLAENYAKTCPTAFVVVAMKPVNSTLPLVCKVAATVNHNVQMKRILGFMSFDVTTANILWAKISNTKDKIAVPVIGGVSAYTAIPLFSQLQHHSDESDDNKEEKNALLKKLTENLRKKNELHLLTPKASLATAASIAAFVISLATAIRGGELHEYAFVHSEMYPPLTYLAGPIQLGPCGVQKLLPLPKLSKYEKLLLESVPYYLCEDIKRGEEFAEKYLGAVCK